MLARIETQVLGVPSVFDSAEGVSSFAAAELLSLLEDTNALHLTWFIALRDLVTPDVFVDVIARSTAPLTMGLLWFRRAPQEGLFPALVRGLATAPGSARLQHALFLLVRTAPRFRGRIPPDFEPFGDTVDAWMLRFVTGRATAADLPTLATLLAAADGNELRADLNLFAICAPSAPHLTPLIDALVALPTAPPALRATAVDFLADRLARASSDLSRTQTWLDAGLPDPPPVRPPTEPPDVPGAHLASFEITNLRAFDACFKVTAPRPSGEGQWLMFLGENATGKTTLLRALALALAHPSDAAAIPSNLDGPLRRTAALDGVARVRTYDGRDLLAMVSSADGGERVTSTPEDALRPWVVAYGCRRGSATSGTDMDTAFVAFRDLDNLFDRPRGVVRASAWLKELQRRARNNGSRSKEVFEAARAALKETLLDAEDVLLDDEVTVCFPNGRTVPLNLLSDGYLTTAGWVADLMARWIKRCEDRRRPISKDFCAEMEGVCLLDEVDLHLHPRWQERVIEDVRKLFPKMTFIATTHHPLTLRGARPGEVFVLGDHDGTGQVTALQRDIPAGTRVDELVTGAWFNRPSAIVDQDTRDLLDRHQRLIVEGAKAGSPERKKVEAELRKRLGRYADTSLERLAATIVAQHLDAALPEPSAQQREEVRAEVLKVLARREARKK